MAESITSEVVGKVVLPAGAPAEAGEPPRRGFDAFASKPFAACSPQIQDLVRGVLRMYEDAPFSSAAGHKVLSRFVHNATWDTPLFFARGTDRMRALARLLGLPFGRIVATPRMLTVSMLNDFLGRIDVEGVIEFYPRIPLWPLLSGPIPVHVSWCIIARGEDDRVLNVTERLHNLPELPYLVRALGATGLSTAALTVANF